MPAMDGFPNRKSPALDGENRRQVRPYNFALTGRAIYSKPWLVMGYVTFTRISSRNQDMKKRGGKRKGAGRKATGKKAVTRSISMLEPAWTAFDEQRGSLSRGAYLMQILGL